MTFKSIQWKGDDIKGRKCLHIVFKHGRAYFHSVRRWFPADYKIEEEHTVLRKYKGYKYVEILQCCLRETWFMVCEAIEQLDKELKE